jgi:glutathione S-transferase
LWAEGFASAEPARKLADMSLERTLHHFPLDPASRQVRLALGEKRLVFAEHQVRYWERPKSLTDLNPSGVTPVLVEPADGDPLVLCETRAILGHLEEAFPETPLLAAAPAERAETRRLLQWFDRKFEFEVGSYILHEKMEKRLLGLGAPELANLRHAREGLKVHLRYMDGLLVDRDWLAGGRLSLADFAAAAHLSVIDYFGDVPWADFAGVKTWYMKLKSRPAFRPLLQDRWPGLTPAAHYDDLDF